jgi:hypothetical protein
MDAAAVAEAVAVAAVAVAVAAAVAAAAVAEAVAVAGLGVAGLGVADELHPATALISNPATTAVSALDRGRLPILFIATSI